MGPEHALLSPTDLPSPGRELPGRPTTYDIGELEGGWARPRNYVRRKYLAGSPAKRIDSGPPPGGAAGTRWNGRSLW